MLMPQNQSPDPAVVDPGSGFKTDRVQHIETEQPTRSGEAPMTAPEKWVDDYGDILFRYACVRLRDPSLAEDVVQETFLAGWKARGKFSGHSTEKGWLFGILKHKITDQLRRLAREISLSDPDFFQEGQEQSFQGGGFSKGSWTPIHAPRRWEQPERSLEDEEFWGVFHRCTAKLPPNVARVFLMRELEDVAAPEICECLNISPNNFWVMMHRARLALRRCLELNWFRNRASAEHGQKGSQTT
jgi:RNA polymerase sigma-70 factor (ECF subfamily)